MTIYELFNTEEGKYFLYLIDKVSKKYKSFTDVIDRDLKLKIFLGETNNKFTEYIGIINDLHKQIETMLNKIGDNVLKTGDLKTMVRDAETLATYQVDDFIRLCEKFDKEYKEYNLPF